MIIAVIGKGGVGKTTVTALLLRRLIESGQTPVLAIDADPSSCLGAALGLRVERTLAQEREALREPAARPQSMSQTEWLSIKMQQVLIEQNGFDLLTMGRPEGPGCYCFVNNLIRDHLDRLGRSYRHVLLDCEAGLEHLSRRTAGRPDALVCVVSRQRMSAETIHRSLGVYTELHGSPPARADLLLNGLETGEPWAVELANIAANGSASFRHILVIPPDASVAEQERAGRSLFDLDPKSPAIAAIAAWECS